MTYDTDPTRWTDTPGAAPELLRDAFEAGHREGPSELQMRGLALKLAALSGGAALAVSASPAQAGVMQASSVTAGASITTSSGALSFAKVAVSLALLGAAAAGTVIYHDVQAPLAQRSEPSAAVQTSAPAVAHVVLPPAVEGRAARTAKSAASVPEKPVSDKLAAVAMAAERPNSEPTEGSERQAASEQPSQQSTDGRARSARERRRRSDQRSQTPAAAVTKLVQEESEAPREARETNSATQGEGAPVQEIDLLRSARANLTARPREAYRLTELHRREFPEGVFVQERDALAIEALLRAGELKEARARAGKFVERYPSSPHAHRFRESLEIP